VLFSGLGPDAQKQLAVGVGTLAGSTIMLLTIPWSLCHLLGRVDMVQTADGPHFNYKGKPKLSEKYTVFSWANLFETGVQVTDEIPTNAKIMLLTAAAYLIIWIPAITYRDLQPHEAAAKEKYYALAGLIVTFVAFIAYSVYMVYSANAADAYNERQAALIRQRFEQDVSFNIYSFVSASITEESAGLSAGLLSKDGQVSEYMKQRLAPVLRSLWAHADMDQNGCLDADELRFLLCEALKAKHMSEVPTAEVAALMTKYDKDNNSTLEFDEFEVLFFDFVLSHKEDAGGNTPPGAVAPGLSSVNGAGGSSERQERFKQQVAQVDEDAEEEEDEESEHSHLSPTQVLLRAAGTIFVGVAIVTLFSDPMVDVLTVFGDRISVPPFYISFIVTPLVSNASELIASIVFASKRTSASMTMTFSALLGAATMNNTFVLAIFLALVYFKELAWEFTAEVLVILVVEIIMFAIAFRKNFPSYWAWVVLSLFPLSIVFVFLLENVGGLQ
jgi:Ca2+/Na+ antiporter